jgi:large subunit ribosomal protein L17
MLSNMASSLILHKRITTTVAKAKALRKFLEPLITKSKTDTTHSRRVVFSYLQDKESVRELFDEVSEKINTRPGGYTRIIKTGSRLGDNAEMCIMELVDYNELLLKETKEPKAKTRRSRRGKKSAAPAAVAADPKSKDKGEEAVVEAQEETSAKAEETVAETKESATADEAADVEEKKAAQKAPEASAEPAAKEAEEEEKADDSSAKDQGDSEEKAES